MDMTALKARLFELLDAKETLENKIEKLEEIIKEREERIEELEHDLHHYMTVADRRAEMLRDLALENRKLREEARQRSKEEIRKEVLEEINEMLQRALKAEAPSYF